MMDVDLLELLKNENFRHAWMNANLLRLIGLQVRQLRNQHGMTQKEFSDFVGTSQGNISDLELAKQSPNLETLFKIARACDVAMIVRFCGWKEFANFVGRGVNEINSFSEDDFN